MRLCDLRIIILPSYSAEPSHGKPWTKFEVSKLFHLLLCILVLAKSVQRQPFGHKTHQSMELSPAGGPQIMNPVGNNNGDKVDIADDEWWDSIFGIGHTNATGDQPLPEPTIGELSSTPPSSNSKNHSSSLYPLNSYSARARSSYQASQSLPEFLTTCDTRFAPHPDGPSHTFSSSMFGITRPYDLLGTIDICSAGRESGPEHTTPPDQSYVVRCGLEQQPQNSSPVTETSIYEAHHGTLLFGLDGSSLHSQTSDALAINRAGCFLSDNLAEPYSYSVEDHRRAQNQNAIFVDDYEEVPVEHLSSTSPVWRHGNQLGAHSASDPTSPSLSPPRDLSQASLSTAPSISASCKKPSSDDSWKCDNCGRVLATKGTKNRNRNKRRHRCPGTSPEYPCPICPKEFNRSDTRLLHLRKWHPEVNIKSPRPRHKKNI